MPCGSIAWPSSMIRAYLFGTGPATALPGGLHAFIKTRPELAVPDIGFQFKGVAKEAYLWFPGIKPPFADGYGIRPVIAASGEPGEIRLRSADPRDPMRIIGNFLSAPNDLATLREGFKRARDVAHQKPLDPYRGKEVSPGPQVRTDAEIDAWLRKTLVTATSSRGHLSDGHDAGYGARRTTQGSWRRPVARRRCLRHARHGFRPHQCARVDDGREGRGDDPR